LLRIGTELNVKIGVEQKKMNGHLLSLYPNATERNEWFTVNEQETNVHVCRMNYCGELWPYFRKFVGRNVVERGGGGWWWSCVECSCRLKS
jgi:hypothetical protein